MADPSGSTRRPSGEVVSQSRISQSAAAGKAPESSSATFGSVSRDARSPRSPAITRDGTPTRYPSAPFAPVEQRTRRTTPGTATTLPPPETSQKATGPADKRSNSTNNSAPVSYNRRTPIPAATDYRIEPQRKESSWLAPPKPVSDFRQSGSSFQTEPSSYYSADDDVASNGPPPPMPVPQPAPAPEGGDHYESLWRAAQVPPMPTPNNIPPPMPTPYGREESTFMYTENTDDDGSPDVGSSHDEHHLPRDLYDSSWLADPSPGIPMPSLTSPSMPSAARPAGVRPPSPNTYGSDSTSGQTSPGLSGSLTAPLRIYHHSRTTGISGSKPPAMPSVQSDIQPRPSASSMPRPSPSPSPAPQPAMPEPTEVGLKTHSASLRTSSASRPAGTRPSAQLMDFNPPRPADMKPQSERPTGSYTRPTPISQSTSANASTVQPILQSSSRYDSSGLPSRPAASSPGTGPGQASIYAQNTTTRLDSSTQNSGPAFGSVSGASRIENKPPARTQTQGARPPAAATAIGQKPASTLTQTAPPRTEYNHAVRPTVTGPSAVSTSVAPRPQAPQAQHRPQASEPTRPSAVSTPAPAPPPAPAPTPAAKLHQKEDAAAQASAALASGPTRPRLHGSKSQMDTQYVNMMLALDDIPALHNLAAAFFAWILLAGFILFPGTFVSLQNLTAQTGTQTPAVAQELINKVTQLPLFVVAWVCTAVGALGLIWLWWRWRKNYLFGLNKIFLPGFLNSLAGLLSTLASIFGAQHGQFSTTSKSTLIVTGASSAVFAIFTAVYALWFVRRVKARHDREVGRQLAGKHGEGAVDASTRNI